MATILLANDFTMEYLTSNKMVHADSLLRLIPKYAQLLEDSHCPTKIGNIGE